MADRYWVGGTSSWDATAGTKWATTSGGAGGAAVPTAADDVYFNAASGAVTITHTSVARARNLTFTGFTGTFNVASNVNMIIGDALGGNLILAAGMTVGYGSASSGWRFDSTSDNGGAGWSITSAGKSLRNLTLNGTGGRWKFTDAATLSGGNNVLTVTLGHMDFNGQTVSLGTLTTASGTLLTLGAAAVTATGAWTVDPGTTFSGASSTLNLTGSNLTFAAGGKTYGTVRWNGTNMGGWTISGANTFTALSLIPVTGSKQDSLTLPDGTTQTVTGTFTVTGTSRVNQIFVRSTTPGTVSTISAATTSLTNVDFRDVTATGVAAWTGTAVGNAQGNTGITFTASQDQHWIGGTGNWSDPTKWSQTNGGSNNGRIPLPQDDVFFDSGSSTGTVSWDQPRGGRNWDFTGSTITGFTVVTAFAILQHSMFGNLTLNSGVTYTMTADAWSAQGRLSTQTIQSNGATMNMSGNWTPVGPNGKVTLLDALSLSVTTTLRVGAVSSTFDAATFNVTAGAVVVLTTCLLGSGTWSLTGGGSVWSAGTAISIGTAGSTIVVANTGAAAKAFLGGGFSYSTVQVTAGGAGAVTFSGANGIALLQIFGPKSVIFTAGTTMTITQLELLGSAGNTITVTSTSSGSPATLAVSSAAKVFAFFVNLKDNTVTPSGVDYNGTDTGGNTGWTFTNSPIAFTASPSDNLGVTDANLKGLGVGASDSTGITDTTADAIGRFLSDTLGLTDAATSGYGLVLPNDLVGLTDAAAAELGLVLADGCDLTDLVDVLRAALVTVDDDIAVTDETVVETATAILVAVTDPVDLTDPVISDVTITTLDDLGLADDDASSFLIGVTLTDSTDLLDTTDPVVVVGLIHVGAELVAGAVVGRTQTIQVAGRALTIAIDTAVAVEPEP